MVCPSSAVVIARRQCQSFLIVRTVRHITKSGGSSNDSGSGTDDWENNNTSSEHILFRQRIPLHASVPLTGKHVTTRWNIWRTSSCNSRCDECGKPLKNIPSSTPSSRYLICENCRRLFSCGPPDEDDEKGSILKASEADKKPPYPKEIYGFLNKYIIGQEQAKKTLSVGVYQHYLRLYHNIENNVSSPAMNNAEGNRPRTGASSSGVLYQEDYSRTSRADIRFFSEVTAPQQKHRIGSPVFRPLPENDVPIRLEKSNILLLGPSGVGKTFITQTLARILDVPIALCDCTSMTQAGYVGEDVESVVQKLVQNAGGNVERAQQGIVFLDEIDKIAAAHNVQSHAFRDVSGEGVQHALLKLVEGTLVNVKSSRKSMSTQQDFVQVDTTDILFVASGAFTALDRIVGKRLDKKTLGLGAKSGMQRITDDDKLEAAISKKRDDLLRQADQGDLISFGIVPELVGRFPVIVPFHSLDKGMLVRVLTEPTNSLLAQKKLEFAMDGADLSFSSDALDEIAALALERKTGARALRSIVEKVLLEAKFTVPGSDIESVHINRECVQGKADYVYTRRAQQATG
ncbi:ATP-dependent Clp protease, ATP-binding subunit, putative [Brugia malayi]|uniref:ATP-dependent Clp protease, ATP-binding subunit, putative n=1 Tax=Brugia malayi TaxID=6279 RepID=A0A0J9XLH7_BRUMA|nr:ATP-dependent Clp protease, ATP-binding subunit, putative [Brugia malayi]CDP90941.1 Bm4855 [Brugia malayi]VIO95633.1 ATP-dependent Clp protease, ATP-binding subunit, putative [Brugia malayi]